MPKNILKIGPKIGQTSSRFKLLSESDLEVDRAVDCGMALVHQLGVWNLGLPTPAQIRPENALRNRVQFEGFFGIFRGSLDVWVGRVWWSLILSLPKKN